MKKMILVLFTILCFEAIGQSKADSISTESREIFTMVDESASFPGGLTELSKFLSRNTRYPKQARKQKIQETVLVSFIVEKDGSISNITGYFKNNILLREEAVRVISKMPYWIPASINGEKVRQQFLQPVQFKL